MGRAGRGESGTVTAVGAATVTIKTSTATTTYAITSATTIIDNGKSTLSAIKTGDTVFFTLTTAKTPTIAQLFTGTPNHGSRPGGPGFGSPGGHGFPGMPGRGESGTVTAVGAATVTIKTSTATTTYAITSATTIIDNGKSTLSAIKTGDTVFFTLTTAKTPTIAQLFTGTPNHGSRPGGPGGFGSPGGHGFPGGFGGSGGGFGSPPQSTA